MPSAPNPGYVSLQQYLTANQGALGNTAQTLADAGAQQGQNAQNEANAVGAAAEQASRAAGQAVDPTTVAGYEQAQQDAIAAQQYLNNLGSYGGLAADAQQQFGKQAPYTAGDNRFDAMLLGSSPDAKATFDATRQQYGGLTDYLQNAANAGASFGAPNGQAPADPNGPAPWRTTQHPEPYQRPFDRNTIGGNQGRNNTRNTDAGVLGSAAGFGYRGGM